MGTLCSITEYNTEHIHIILIGLNFSRLSWPRLHALMRRSHLISWRCAPNEMACPCRILYDLKMLASFALSLGPWLIFVFLDLHRGTWGKASREDKTVSSHDHKYQARHPSIFLTAYSTRSLGICSLSHLSAGKRQGTLWSLVITGLTWRDRHTLSHHHLLYNQQTHQTYMSLDCGGKGEAPKEKPSRQGFVGVRCQRHSVHNRATLPRLWQLTFFVTLLSCALWCNMWAVMEENKCNILYWGGHTNVSFTKSHNLWTACKRIRPWRVKYVPMKGWIESTVSHADKNLWMRLHRNKLISEEGKSTFGLRGSQRLILKPNLAWQT